MSPRQDFVDRRHVRGAFFRRRFNRVDRKSGHFCGAPAFIGVFQLILRMVIHRPNHSAVQPFRLIGTCAGLRPKIPELVFDTTFRSRRRPTRGCLVGKGSRRQSLPVAQTSSRPRLPARPICASVPLLKRVSPISS